MLISSGKTIKINGIPFQVIGETTSTGSTGFMNSDDMILSPISNRSRAFSR